MEKNKKGLIDWPTIALDYVTSTSSTEKIAKKYKVTWSAVRKECESGKWVKKRKEYQDKLVQDVAAKTRKEKVNIVCSELKACNAMVEAVTAALEDPNYLYVHLVKFKDGDLSGTIEQESKVLNTRSLLEIATSMEKLTNIKTFFNRVLIESDHQRIELEREKFEHQKVMDAKRIELEMEKIKLAGGGDEKDHSAGLVFMPPRLEREEDE